jgi:glycosyltransferase involved in cell wall biosynthesis
MSRLETISLKFKGTLPQVSILINNYNYETYLAEAIDSALSQTYDNCEVIVVDDGSTDGSREIIKAYGDQLTAVFQNNGGQASAFNRGFAEAIGDFVIFLDADDALEVNCVESCLAGFSPELARSIYRLSYIDGGSHPIETLNRKARDRKMAINYEVNFEAGVFEAVSGTPTSGNFFSRWALEKILPIKDTERFRICADQYLFLHTAAVGPIGLIDQFLAQYRLHGANNFASDALSLKLIQSRCSNVQNKILLKREIFEANGGQYPPSEYYKTWEEFESMFLAMRYRVWPSSGEGGAVVILKQRFRTCYLNALKAGQFHQFIMLTYVLLIRSLPMVLVKSIFSLNRRLRAR